MRICLGPTPSAVGWLEERSAGHSDSAHVAPAAVLVAHVVHGALVEAAIDAIQLLLVGCNWCNMAMVPWFDRGLSFRLSLSWHYLVEEDQDVSLLTTCRGL
jgi:hypothetical protein